MVQNLYKMNYYEIIFNVEPNTETNRDVLAAVLAEIGFESFSENPDGINAYISDKLYDNEKTVDCITDFPIEDTKKLFELNFSC